jgi:hypothetical protein
MFEKTVELAEKAAVGAGSSRRGFFRILGRCGGAALALALGSILAGRANAGGTGACIVEGKCIDRLTQSYCETVLGGVYLGDGTACPVSQRPPGISRIT